MPRSEKTITEYRLIATWPESYRELGKENLEYVAMTRNAENDTPEGMREEYSWYLTERAGGDFVRVEKRVRHVVTETTEWEEVLGSD